MGMASVPDLQAWENMPATHSMQAIHERAAGILTDRFIVAASSFSSFVLAHGENHTLGMKELDYNARAQGQQKASPVVRRIFQKRIDYVLFQASNVTVNQIVIERLPRERQLENAPQNLKRLDTVTFKNIAPPQKIFDLDGIQKSRNFILDLDAVRIRSLFHIADLLLVCKIVQGSS